MANIREKYKEHFKKYKRISIIYENKFNIIYNAEYKETEDKVILKVYTNELIEKGPEELLYKQIKREIELTQLCQCDNVIKLYNNKDEIDKIIKKIEKEDIDIIILEYEYCYYESLVNEIGHMSRDEDEKKLFVNIVRSLAKV